MRNYFKKLVGHEGSFLQQLTVSFTVGITTLILVASIVISWLASNRTEDSLVKQGHQITENMARQSVLALLFGEGENAKEAARGALAFPDVLSVYLYDTSLQLILHEGESFEQERISFSRSMSASEVIVDDKTHWRFRAPVYSRTNQEDELFMQDVNTEPELLGYADVVLSKATLVDTTTSIFLVNSIIFLALASVLLLVLRFMAKRITQPLHVLSSAMHDAELGDDSAYVDGGGPQEVKVIGHAFNKMISAINERDRELRNQNVTLEKRVKERTVELAEARDKAIEASVTKSRFLANMSHELRTPLNAIIGYSELLMEDIVELEDETTYGDLQKVKASGVHLLSLINDILDLSKIEAGKMDLSLEEFSVCEMVGNINIIVEPLAKKNNNAFRISCPENIGSMRSDELKIRQSLINLLGNACKFTRDGEVSLTVSSQKRGDVNGVSFSIVDQGIGMSSLQVSNLFNEFSQADSSTTRKYGGTGLGLAISKRFCELMGGDITVDSVDGKGSTFTIFLPVSAPIDDTVARREDIRQKDRRKKESRLVILDSNEQQRLLLQNTFKQKGFNVAEGETIDTAINWGADTAIINIFSDELDGCLDELSVAKTPYSYPLVLFAQDGVTAPGIALRSLLVEKPAVHDHDSWPDLSRYVQNNEIKDVLVVTQDSAWFEGLVESASNDDFNLIKTDGSDVDKLFTRISPSVIFYDVDAETLTTSASLIAMVKENRKNNVLVIWVYSDKTLADVFGIIKEKVQGKLDTLGMAPDEFSTALIDLVSNDMRLR